MISIGIDLISGCIGQSWFVLKLASRDLNLVSPMSHGTSVLFISFLSFVESVVLSLTFLLKTKTQTRFVGIPINAQKNKDFRKHFFFVRIIYYILSCPAWRTVLWWDGGAYVGLDVGNVAWNRWLQLPSSGTPRRIGCIYVYNGRHARTPWALACALHTRVTL